MPQKHPAASVAFCAPSGTFIATAGPSGAKWSVDEENGRRNRWMNDVIARPPTKSATTRRTFEVVSEKVEELECCGLSDMEDDAGDGGYY
jgi:hypothetical protein